MNKKPPSVAIMPFKALEAEFGKNALVGKHFDTLDDASKALATRGREAAASILGGVA